MLQRANVSSSLQVSLQDTWLVSHHTWLCRKSRPFIAAPVATSFEVKLEQDAVGQTGKRDADEGRENDESITDFVLGAESCLTMQLPKESRASRGSSMGR